uniref:Transmembrane protein n=1 Tax=Strigamia maritima TaxID=126957 RepID=T1IQL7_STRMM
MDIENGEKSSSMEDKEPDSTEGLRQRYSRLADEVIEKLIMECSTDEEYQKVVSKLLDEAPSPNAVAALRLKLNVLRQMMVDKDTLEGSRKNGMIDDKFLSITFAVALIVIIAVTLYAFQGLFSAISKKAVVNTTRPFHKFSET